MQSHFSERFWPYQIWRFIVINARMYLIARGTIGPHREAEASGRPPR